MTKIKLNILVIDNSQNNIDQVRSVFAKAEKENLLPDFNTTIYPNYDNGEDEIKTFISNVQQLSSYVSKDRKITDIVNYIENYIDKYHINAIFLDFLLSSEEERDDNARIQDTTGGKLLKVIKSNKKYKDLPIIGFTIKKDQLRSAQQTGSKVLFSINKDFSTDYFYQESANIIKLYYEVKKFSKQQYADIVVITALKKELKPIIELLENKDKNEETSAIGYIKDKNNKKLKVVAATEERMGMAEAATLTTKMTIEYNPKFVVMTGIAAGIDKEKQKFLDILIPKYVFNWQSGKYKVKKSKEEKKGNLHVFDREFYPQPTYIEKNTLSIEDNFIDKPKLFLEKQGLLSYDEKNIKKFYQNIKDKEPNKQNEFEKELSNMYQSKKEFLENKLEKLKKEKKDTKHIKEELDKLDEHNIVFNFIDNIVKNLECKIYKDGMVSGSAVVADEDIVEKHINQRKVDGIDMEAYGVAYASNHSETTPKVLIIKAISDFANEEKNDIYQAMASYVSAQVFYEIFTKYIDF